VKDWNLLVTAQLGRERFLWSGIRHRGLFHRTGFKGVLVGRVQDPEQFLEDLLRSKEEGKPWVEALAKAIPAAITFSFTPETFEDRLKEAVTPFLDRMEKGTYYVRVERRGFKGQIVSPEVERAVDAYLFDRARQQGKSLEVSFQDPDYVVAAETVGDVCGVALLTREMRSRYPFVKIR
jgi:tRNA(Ser,Leu) C12 N-acetylase TAN1